MHFREDDMDTIGIKCHGAIAGGGTIWEVRDNTESLGSKQYLSFGQWRTNKFYKPNPFPRDRQWFDLGEMEWVTKEKQLKKLDALCKRIYEKWSKEHDVCDLSKCVFQCIFLKCTNCGEMFIAPPDWTTNSRFAFEAWKKGWSSASCSQYGIIGVYCPKCTKAGKKGKKLKKDYHLRSNMKYNFGENDEEDHNF